MTAELAPWALGFGWAAAGAITPATWAAVGALWVMAVLLVAQFLLESLRE